MNQQLFEGKWKWLDEKVALQARECLQSIVDGLPEGEEVPLMLSTTVVVTAREPESLSTTSRMSSGIEDSEDLKGVLNACLDNAQTQGGQIASQLTPEGERSVRKMAEYASQMLLRVASDWGTQFTNRLEPHVSELIEKFERRSDLCETEDQKLNLFQDFIGKIEDLLDSIEIAVTVGGQSFEVKGFRP